jgi:hypothetical protein
MMTVPTGAGQVQEHEAGSDPGVAVENLGSNDRAGPCGDVPLGRDRCTMVPLYYWLTKALRGAILMKLKH